MAYIFSDEELLMKQAAEEFIQQEGIPALMAQMPKAAEGKPMDCALGIWNKLAEKGFIGISTAESMGGLGMGVKAELVAVEALAAAGPFATNIDAHNLALRCVEFNGSDYQKEKYGIPGARGEIMFAAAVTDPAGSMNMPEWSIDVKEVEDGYILNGSKVFCTNSHGADVYLVFTKDYENGYPMGAYLVEKDMPGFVCGEIEPCGVHGTCTGTIYLNDVKVPKENKIPAADLGNAAWLALGYLDASIIFIAMARGVLEKTKAYVKTRTRNGKPLCNLQAVAHRIVNMEMQLEQARAITYTAAELWDAGAPDLKLHSYAKITSSEALTKISHDCVVLHGGYGLNPDTGVFGTYCGAPAGHVGECPNDFHRDLVAGLLGMKQDSWLNDPVK